MKNPFEKHDVVLSLSIGELGVLLSSLRRSIPEGKDEENIVISLSNQLIEKLNELNEN